MREKEKRWQRTVDRLQRQVTEFTRKNAELQDEVQRLNQQAAQTQQASWLKEVAAAKKGISARTRRAGSLGPTSPSSGPRAAPAPVALATAPQHGSWQVEIVELMQLQSRRPWRMRSAAQASRPNRSFLLRKWQRLPMGRLTFARPANWMAALSGFLQMVGGRLNSRMA